MKLKRRFTKWYIKKGYTFGYDFQETDVYTDGTFTTLSNMPPVRFNCPWWVMPFLILFSPSIYYAETVGKKIAEGFAAGLKKGGNDNERTRN